MRMGKAAMYLYIWSTLATHTDRDSGRLTKEVNDHLNHVCLCLPDDKSVITDAILH